MKTIANVLGVARSHLHERVHRPTAARGSYCKAADEELLPLIRRLVDERPTYGYRRVTAVLAGCVRCSSIAARTKRAVIQHRIWPPFDSPVIFTQSPRLRHSSTSPDHPLIGSLAALSMTASAVLAGCCCTPCCSPCGYGGGCGPSGCPAPVGVPTGYYTPPCNGSCAY